MSDLNEVLLGNGYIPSSEIEYLRNGSIGWQLNILDDDINTVIAYNAVKNRTEMDGVYYGYTTWQMEVGRNPVIICPVIMVTGMLCISESIP